MDRLDDAFPIQIQVIPELGDNREWLEFKLILNDHFF